ncbi:MAG: hypothetical protein WKF96_19210 [Solirubrobacteraceae bacterium]
MAAHAIKERRLRLGFIEPTVLRRLDADNSSGKRQTQTPASDQGAVRMNHEIMHPVYLPFTEEQVRKHFAPINNDRGDIERHLTHYKKSIERNASHDPSDHKADRHNRQIEKDERFWVMSALMALHQRSDASAAFSALLERAGLAPVGNHPTWSDALAGPLSLFFEVSLNAPKSYRTWLKEVGGRTPIPYAQEAARRSRQQEGATHVDAVLVAPETGVGVLFEAKVLSDCSSTVTYDVMRNQIARNVDVMLDRQERLPEPLNQRDPALSAFVLLTPEIFRDAPHTRLYGWLMEAYRGSPETLGRDLRHRGDEDWPTVSKRLGWATFEDCRRIDLDACRWLPVDGGG